MSLINGGIMSVISTIKLFQRRQLTKFSIRMCVLSLLTTGIICLAQEHAPEGAFAAMLAANDALITAAERGDIPAIDAALAAGADIKFLEIHTVYLSH